MDKIKRGRRKLKKENLLTPKQVSEMVHCHLNTVYNWVYHDGLKSYRATSGRIYLDPEDVKEFLRKWY